MASFKFELVTPEKLIYSAAVESVIVPGSEGDFEILANHAPVMTMIRPGIINVQETAGASRRRLFVSAGFVEVNPQGMTILAEKAVALEDFTADKLAAEVAAAEAAVKEATDDVTRAEAALRVNQLNDLRGNLH